MHGKRKRSFSWGTTTTRLSPGADEGTGRGRLCVGQEQCVFYFAAQKVKGRGCEE